MSDLKPEVEHVIKIGRLIVDKKQVDFPDTLGKQLDAIKQQYNKLGIQVGPLCIKDYHNWLYIMLTFLFRKFFNQTQ
jgi:hypothetical protein